MADEPESHTLRLLRDIRAKVEELGAVRAKLDEHDKRFDRLDKQGDEMRQYVSYALGVGAMHGIKLREVDARQEEQVARDKRMDDLMAEIERRLKKVEEPAD